MYCVSCHKCLQSHENNGIAVLLFCTKRFVRGQMFVSMYVMMKASIINHRPLRIEPVRGV